MLNSYSSTFTVHPDTQQKNEHPETRSQQRVEVPVRYVEDVKIGGNRTRMLTRAVTVLGTVEVSHYGTRRVEYGKCNVNGHVVSVVEDGTGWCAVDRKPITGCVTKGA